MPRATIDYGIDLGTTNSAIAVLQGTTSDVIPNNVGNRITPSAVFLEKTGKNTLVKSLRIVKKMRELLAMFVLSSSGAWAQITCTNLRVERAPCAPKKSLPAF